MEQREFALLQNALNGAAKTSDNTQGRTFTNLLDCGWADRLVETTALLAKRLTAGSLSNIFA